MTWAFHIAAANCCLVQVCITEIGSGSGGTSAVVMDALAPFATSVDFLYTDISPALVGYGRRTYGGEYPFARFQLLDVEKDVQGEGIGSYDIVFGTNVLHATRNMGNTLQNCKALLRRGGLMIANELTTKTEFLTLTFGLTEGWWMYDDQQWRMPGARSCSPARSDRTDFWWHAGCGIVAAEPLAAVAALPCPPTTNPPRTDARACADQQLVTLT